MEIWLATSSSTLPWCVKIHSIAEIEWCIDGRKISNSVHFRRRNCSIRGGSHLSAVCECTRMNAGNDWMGRQMIFAVRSTPSWTKTTRHKDSKAETATAGRWRGRARVTTQHNRKWLILTFCCTHSLCVLDDLIVEKEFRSLFCRCFPLHGTRVYLLKCCLPIGGWFMRKRAEPLHQS